MPGTTTPSSVRAPGLNGGSLSIGRAEAATALELPTLIPPAASGDVRTVMRHRQVEPLVELSGARVGAIDDRPFPVQVGGDYSEVEFGMTPRGLLAISERSGNNGAPGYPALATSEA